MISLRRDRVPSRLRVLITGCSSGIGRDSATAFVARGHDVIASARNPESLSDLVEAGARAIALDVTSEASMTAAWGEVHTLVGGIDVLVNNAGYGLYGPVEEQSIDDARRQFETNLFGPARLIQLALPAMRDRGFGRIINVSSMGGRTTLPGGGYYHSSKYALEALSDALRIEVAPFGVDVTLVEPGPVRTPWTDTALSNLILPGAPANGSPYDSMRNAVATLMTSTNSGPRTWYASSPEEVARVIVGAAEADHPRARYLVGGAAHLLVGIRRVLPDRLYDAFLRKQYKLAGRARPAQAPAVASSEGTV